MQLSQYQKAEKLKQLHQREGIFIIPNPWDAGSAKMLAALGFEALATTSAGLAFSLGKADGISAVSREETLANAHAIVEAVDLPVSADLENGYGIEPSACAETIVLAAGTGLAGGSIEDSTGNPADPIIPFPLAVERVKAAVQAAHSLPFAFTLTARAENFIHGKPNLDDTIKRLAAFAEAGADVLYAPGLTNIGEVEAIVRAVTPKPVNMVIGLGNTAFTLQELEQAGVKRVSLGSTLARVAYSAFFNAAAEIQHNKTFSFTAGTMSYAAINKLFR